MKLSEYELKNLSDKEIEKRYNIQGYFYSFDKENLLAKKYSEVRETAKNMLDLYNIENEFFEKDKADVVTDLLDKAEELYTLTQLAKPTSAPIYNDINNNGGFKTMTETNKKFGISGKEYRDEFFNQFKSGFRNASGHLAESILVQGGYTVPTEMHTEIVRRLSEKNVMRQISRIVETNNDRDIVVAGSAPNVSWIDEGGEISLTNMTFGKKTLGAHKLGTAIAVSNELIADSYYNLADHIYSEFSDAIAKEEENVFLNGVASDTSTPTGLLNQLDTSTDTVVTTTGASIAADDIINVETKLDTPYRKNAVWLMNPVTLGIIRKLKDNNQQYIWQQNFADSTPLTLLGYPVYLSPYMPTIAAGNTVILFGDFSRFFLGQRGELSFKPLYETRALTDETVYLLLERVDCTLVDTNAIVSLQMKSE